jgi:hypothetical protein
MYADTAHAVGGAFGPDGENLFQANCVDEGATDNWQYPTPSISSGEIMVGYRHSLGLSGPVNCNYHDEVWEGVLRFDVSKLPSKHIAFALMKISAVDGINSPGNYVYEKQSNLSCVVEGGFAKSDDWEKKKQTTIPFDRDATTQLSDPNLSLDVTDMVNQWINGRPNYGIVLAGAGNLVEQDDKECLSVYQTGDLHIVFANY